MVDARENALGNYLRARRQKLDPVAFGFPPGRRRTAGLRREEVAQRARISPTWYTWLEQGRGGSPSADALDRIAKAMKLTDVEREHLFFLGLGRAPEARYRNADAITPRLQRLIDTFSYAPALVRTATWDVLAWNRAASHALVDFGTLPLKERNILRMMFCDPRMRAAQFDWDTIARFLVSGFRLDAARAGASSETEPLVRELCASSPEFAAMWRENDVHAYEGDGIKRFRHPELGVITVECSVFAVDGRPDLQMLVLNPATREDRDRIKSLIVKRPAARGEERKLRKEEKRRRG